MVKIDNELIKKISENVKNLFPENIELRRDKYRERRWIFPNHFLIAIDIAKKLCEKYGGNVLVCEAALLLHDTGLVYKREDSPVGHEEKGVEYSLKLLKELDVDESQIEEIIKCVKATDPDLEISTLNQKIVRSSDALSQIDSMHFFAKAHFFDEIEFFVKWFKKKINKNIHKVIFEDEKKEAQIIVNHYNKILDSYEKFNFD